MNSTRPKLTVITGGANEDQILKDLQIAADAMRRVHKALENPHKYSKTQRSLASDAAFNCDRIAESLGLMAHV